MGFSSILCNISPTFPVLYVKLPDFSSMFKIPRLENVLPFSQVFQSMWEHAPNYEQDLKFIK